MPWLEALAYGLSRGFWRAYFDTVAERSTAVQEAPSHAADAVADAIADAIDKLPPGATRHP